MLMGIANPIEGLEGAEVAKLQNVAIQQTYQSDNAVAIIELHSGASRSCDF
jgi:hypothetical protein